METPKANVHLCWFQGSHVRTKTFTENVLSVDRDFKHVSMQTALKYLHSIQNIDVFTGSHNQHIRWIPVRDRRRVALIEFKSVH